ncbi:MAG: TIGR00153 family protein [Candidatus Altiarchaeota archaeon]
MGLFDLLPLVGRNKERETIGFLQEETCLVYESVRELGLLFYGFHERDDKIVSEKRDSINALEKKSDGLRRQIEESLYQGAFLPMSRSRILDLAEKTDEVANLVQDAAHLTQHMSGDIRVPELDELLKEQVKETLDCVKHLKEAVEQIDDDEKVRQLIKKVEVEEHHVDLIENKLFKKLYEEDYKPKTLILYGKLIEFVGKISNKAEDASDTLSLILLMHNP